MASNSENVERRDLTDFVVKLLFGFYVILLKLVAELLQSLKIFNGDPHFLDFLHMAFSQLMNR